MQPERYHAVDAVRAVALLGIFLVHAHDRYNFFPAPDACTWLDALGDWVYAHLLVSKSFMLFSFLFGLSFYLQLSRAAAKGVDFRARFCWRLVLLMGFGLLHLLFYGGDILLIFGLLGFVLVALWRVRSGVLVGLAALFLLQPISIYYDWTGQPAALLQWSGELTQAWHLPPAPDAATASWWDIARWNTTTGVVQAWLYMLWSSRLWCVLGMFVLGMLAGRHAVLQMRALRLLMLAVVAAAFYVALLLIKGGSPHLTLWNNTFFVLAVLPLLLLLFRHLRALAPLCALGRCTLTCYMAQSIIMAALLCGWGLGLNNSLSTGGIMLLAMAVYLAQMLGSWLWLRFYRFGPLEGLCRALPRWGLGS